MHPADVVASVKKTGTSLRRLALENGFGASTLRAALHKPHPRAQRLIALAIGKPLHEIWPQWFDANGERVAGRMYAPSRVDSLTPDDPESRGPHVSSTQKAA